MRTLNDVKLEELISNEATFLVAWTMAGSIPCDHFRPEYKALEVDLLKFIIDGEENPTAAAAHKVEAVPLTVLFIKGKEFERWEGPYNHLALAERIREARQK